jgi:hypothetical protein
MDTVQANPAARHKSACERENEAWMRVAQCEPTRSPVRAQDVESWLEATREFREAQAVITAVTVQRAKEALRESAALLSDARPVSEPRSLAGSRYVDGNGVTWEVKAVIVDVIEPEFFLVQIASADDADADPIDVYSEDWGLFCLVHKLRAA